jgi:hypothetical protein
MKILNYIIILLLLINLILNCFSIKNSDASSEHFRNNICKLCLDSCRGNDETDCYDVCSEECKQNNQIDQ